MWKVHLLMAAMLVDTHLNDPEQSTSQLLPFTVALLDHLSLFVSQVRVVARSGADPAMFVRRHGSIMHPWRQSDFLCPGSGTAIERRLPSKIWALMGPVLRESHDDRSGANHQRCCRMRAGELRGRFLMLLCLSSGFLLFKPRPVLLGKLPIVIDASL